MDARPKDSTELPAGAATERAVRLAVFQAFAAPALILGPDRLTRSVNAAAQRLSPTPEGHRTTLLEWMREASYEPPPELDGALQKAYEGRAQTLRAASKTRPAVEITLGPVRVSGQVLGVCVTLLPVSEPQGSRRASNYEFAMESTGQVFFVWTPHNDAVAWSGAVRRLFGVTVKDLGAHLADFLKRLPPEDAQGLDQDLRGAVRSRLPMGREFQVRREDGTYRVLQCLGGVGRTRPGDAPSLLGLMSDVTDLAALRQRALDTQKHDALGRLAGGVAHDFNNMLMVVQSCAHALNGLYPGDSPGREELRDILDASSRAADLVRQMLAFARRQSVTPTMHAPAELIERLLPMLRRLLPKGITLKTLIDQAAPTVVLDARQIEQALVNLVVNARDAIGTVGTIEITGRRVVEVDVEGKKREWAEVTVRDDGAGMPPEVLARVFEPYFTTKPVGRGTGLGLASVYGIVRAASGDVTVESREGVGTAFILRFPSMSQLVTLARGQSFGTPASVMAPAPLRSTPAPSESAISVLLVEDDATVRRLVLSVLRGAGFQVTEASGLAEALSRCPAKLDLILTDVRMPEAAGPEVARQILIKHPGARVLYMSGYTGVGPAMEAIEPLIQKPFSSTDLLDTLRAMFSERFRFSQP